MKHKVDILISAGAVMASLAAYVNSPFISKKLPTSVRLPGHLSTLCRKFADATEEDVNAIVLEQIGGDRNPGMVSPVLMGAVWCSRLTNRW